MPAYSSPVFCISAHNAFCNCLGLSLKLFSALTINSFSFKFTIKKLNSVSLCSFCAFWAHSFFFIDLACLGITTASVSLCQTIISTLAPWFSLRQKPGHSGHSFLWKHSLFLFFPHGGRCYMSLNKATSF